MVQNAVTVVGQIQWGLDSEHRARGYVDASEVGFAPGEWPNSAKIDDALFIRTNERCKAPDGSLYAVIYENVMGNKLEVAND